MKTCVFSTHRFRFEEKHLRQANGGRHGLHLLDVKLDGRTAALAAGCEAACLFVSDKASAEVLKVLRECGVQYLVLFSAGPLAPGCVW